MSALLQRAHLLIEQNRPKEALEQLSQHVANEPDDFEGYMVQAICFMQLKELKKAADALRTSLSLEPDHPYLHFLMASVLMESNRFKEADEEIKLAIEINPEEADFYHMRSLLYFQKSDWQNALDQVEIGLSLEPENVDCINQKARCLQQLGRKDEAKISLQAAMNKNPDDSWTHANKGWQELQAGNRKKSLEHFRESLRLEPGNEWARQGLVEALKSGNIFYRLFLGYIFWMQKLPPRTQWGLIIGAYFLYRFLIGVAANNPELKIVIYPLLFLYVGFALSSWIADPLFNLVLRLSPKNRHVLSNQEKTQANIFALFILAGVSFFIAGFYAPDEKIPITKLAFNYSGICMFLALLPIAATFKCQPGWPKLAMGAYTAAMIALALYLFIGCFLFDLPSNSNLFSILGLSFGVSLWVANALIAVRPKII